MPSILTYVAIVPACFAGVYANFQIAMPTREVEPTLRQAVRDLRSTGAVLFALLLFSVRQRGSIAGWLPST